MRRGKRKGGRKGTIGKEMSKRKDCEGKSGNGEAGEGGRGEAGAVLTVPGYTNL